MDVLYIFKENKKNDSAELRYSLRSLMNFPHDKVVIAGDKPDWMTNVIHIKVDQSSAKQVNASKNRNAAIQSGVLSEKFLFMNDDFFIMKPMKRMPLLNYGDMKELIDYYMIRYPKSSDYIDTMMSLYRQLIKEGITTPVSFELHAPMVFTIKNINHMYQSLGDKRIYEFRSRYGNFYNLGGQEVLDVKLFNEITHNPSEYRENPKTYMEKQSFISTTGGSFDNGLPGEYIRSQFCVPSPYER